MKIERNKPASFNLIGILVKEKEKPLEFFCKLDGFFQSFRQVLQCHVSRKAECNTGPLWQQSLGQKGWAVVMVSRSRVCSLGYDLPTIHSLTRPQGNPSLASLAAMATAVSNTTGTRSLQVLAPNCQQSMAYFFVHCLAASRCTQELECKIMQYTFCVFYIPLRCIKCICKRFTNNGNRNSLI